MAGVHGILLVLVVALGAGHEHAASAFAAVTYDYHLWRSGVAQGRRTGCRVYGYDPQPEPALRRGVREIDSPDDARGGQSRYGLPSCRKGGNAPLRPFG